MGILQALVRVFFTIGLFGFGGGYSIIALIRHLVVVEEKWLTDLQFIDILAISQVTPGPIAINAATFIGYKMAGIIGGLIATLFSVIAPFLLVYLTSIFIHNIGKEKVDLYLSLLTPLTFALILSGTYSILKESILDLPEFLIFLFALFLGYRYKWSLTRIFLVSGIIGLGIYLIVKT
ncbi:MAG: chromate transporter [Dictyoglomus sp.]